MQTSILIAYDGSTSADAALNDMRRAGLPRTVEALVVSVAEQWLPSPVSYGMVERRFKETSSAAIKAAEKLATGARDWLHEYQKHHDTEVLRSI